jgi:3-deoxy-D-manno-octulosonic-acid transferase
MVLCLLVAIALSFPMMYLIYSFLVTLGVLLTAPYYVWKRRDELAGRRWRERFGLLPESFQQAERGAIWIHAVSVGETLAVVRLARELQQHFSERKIFLSSVTPAGRSAGESRLPSVAGRFYLPMDWRGAVGAALERIRPSLLVIVETELWPNLLRAAHESGARIILVNGRLSPRSFPRYRLVRPLMRRVLEDVDVICAQTEADAERFRHLGATPERLVLAGNLKFDAEPPRAGAFSRLVGKAATAAGRGPIMIAASTMPGEEPMVLSAWSKVRAHYPQALLILAPRHPARFGEVARILTNSGCSHIRRTHLASQEAEVSSRLAAPEILLLDSIGELAGILELADVVFMGGSLVPTGGHNILEAAYWAKPVVFGPHMENFQDIARLFLDANACVQIQDKEELAESVLKLFGDRAAAKRLGARGKQVLERQTGATARVLEQIQRLLKADVQNNPPP